MRIERVGQRAQMGRVTLQNGAHRILYLKATKISIGKTPMFKKKNAPF